MGRKKEETGEGDGRKYAVLYKCLRGESNDSSVYT